MIYTPSTTQCGDNLTKWQERYKALRDRWRDVEAAIKKTDDPKLRRRLEERQRMLGAERNTAMVKIAELVNKVNADG